MKKLRVLLLSLLLLIATSFSACTQVVTNETQTTKEVQTQESTVSSDTPYITLNNNVPEFTKKDYTTKSFENYSELDSLGRCGVAFANVGQDLMPTEKRGSISSVKPTGWHSTKYDCVDGKYLYNRCHLIGYQLTAENANNKNLITGTRYLNIEGMLPFENMVADYVKETNNHVLYRVTPDFVDDELVARGVQIEGWSVEDDGEGVCFNIYAYNIQPGVIIDYKTGDSKLSDSDTIGTGKVDVYKTYVLNTGTKKFHTPECSNAKNISKNKKETFKGNKEDLLAKGYTACKKCNPQ